MSDATFRGIEITDDAPAGKVPGNFARDLVHTFRAEFEAHFLTEGTPCPTPHSTSKHSASE